MTAPVRTSYIGERYPENTSKQIDETNDGDGGIVTVAAANIVTH